MTSKSWFEENKLLVMVGGFLVAWALTSWAVIAIFSPEPKWHGIIYAGGGLLVLNWIYMMVTD